MTPTKILVVDDEVELERLIRQRFRKKIQAKELDFLFATDGREALNQLQADHQVAMVLTVPSRSRDLLHVLALELLRLSE